LKVISIVLKNIVFDIISDVNKEIFS